MDLSQNRVTFRGPSAVVKWGYFTAADTGAWTLHADMAGGGRLTATLVSHDEQRVSQQPLRFVVPRPSGQDWVWPITTLQIEANTLTATLGPQE